MLLGNKTDKEMERRVQQDVGVRLAKVCPDLLRLLADKSLSVSLHQTTAPQQCEVFN